MHQPKPTGLFLCKIAATLLALVFCTVSYQPAHATVIEDPEFIYVQAMYYYKQGEEKLTLGQVSQAREDLELALRLFLSIELYLDSKEWIVKIEVMVNPPASSPHTIENLECYEATPTRLLLSWEDSEPGTYTVSWNPVRARTAPKTITTSQLRAALEGLVPGTRYTVQITPSDGTPLSGSFETMPAEAYTEYAFLPMDLLGNWLNQYKPSVAASYGFHNMLENYDGLADSGALTSLQGMIPVPPAEPGTQSPLRGQDVGFAVSHSFMLTGAPERMTFERRAVLRVPGIGIFEETEDVLLAQSSLYTIHVDLTDMLEAVFVTAGGWDRHEMTLELYFGDALAFTDAITLGVGRSVGGEAADSEKTALGEPAATTPPPTPTVKPTDNLKAVYKWVDTQGNLRIIAQNAGDQWLEGFGDVKIYDAYSNLLCDTAFFTPVFGLEPGGYTLITGYDYDGSIDEEDVRRDAIHVEFEGVYLKYYPQPTMKTPWDFLEITDISVEMNKTHYGHLVSGTVTNTSDMWIKGARDYWGNHSEYCTYEMVLFFDGRPYVVAPISLHPGLAPGESREVSYSFPLEIDAYGEIDYLPIASRDLEFSQ